MNGSSDHIFVCPACETRLAVDALKRDALLAHGCVVCGTPVQRDAFSPTPDQGT